MTDSLVNEEVMARIPPAADFRMTVHAVDRLYQRHPDIFVDPYITGHMRFEIAHQVLNDAIEDRAVKNNTAFMVYVNERYGFEKKYQFFVNGNVLFLGATNTETGDQIIITTMVRDTHVVAHLSNAGLRPEDRYNPRIKRVRFRARSRR